MVTAHTGSDGNPTEVNNYEYCSQVRQIFFVMKIAATKEGGVLR